MPVRIARYSFVAFVRTLAGQQLETGTQHRRFTVQVTAGGLAIVPDSSGQPRSESWAQLDGVLAEFALNGSLQPKDYQQLTRNASYLLRLITLYQEHRSLLPTQ